MCCRTFWRSSVVVTTAVPAASGRTFTSTLSFSFSSFAAFASVRSVRGLAFTFHRPVARSECFALAFALTFCAFPGVVAWQAAIEAGWHSFAFAFANCHNGTIFCRCAPVVFSIFPAPVIFVIRLLCAAPLRRPSYLKSCSTSLRPHWYTGARASSARGKW